MCCSTDFEHIDQRTLGKSDCILEIILCEMVGGEGIIENWEDGMEFSIKFGN